MDILRYRFQIAWKSLEKLLYSILLSLIAIFKYIIATILDKTSKYYVEEVIHSTPSRYGLWSRQERPQSIVVTVFLCYLY